MTIYSEIENVIWEDAGRRNLTPFAPKNELYQAAKSLLGAKHVLIVSGFYIEKKQTGETDGPLGAVFLAQSLERLGMRVSLITSPFNANILREAVQELALSCVITVVRPGEELEAFPRLINDPDVTHLIAIEQMGSAIDGKYYNMSGRDLTSSTARFDSLFFLGRQKGIVTIGIGDGGNEIGMGNLFPFIHQKDQFGWITCITPVDYLIVAGVSNWGAYGLMAALTHLVEKPLLHEAEEEERLLEVILQAGAVDGRTGEASMSVDGLPVSKHKEIVTTLWKVIEYHNSKQMTS